MVQALIDMKIDVNSSDNANRSPLWMATYYGSSGIAFPFLFLFFSFSFPFPFLSFLSLFFPSLPFSLCSSISSSYSLGFGELVRMLATAGASLDQSSQPDEMTPLMLACKHGYTLVVHILLSVGKTKVEQTNRSGITALWFASANVRSLHLIEFPS